MQVRPQTVERWRHVLTTAEDPAVTVAEFTEEELREVERLNSATLWTVLRRRFGESVSKSDVIRLVGEVRTLDDLSNLDPRVAEPVVWAAATGTDSPEVPPEVLGAIVGGVIAWTIADSDDPERELENLLVEAARVATA